MSAAEGLVVDRSGLRPAGPPREIVVARNVADVQETLRRASREGIPVVPRGAGSGLAGGAVAGPGTIVLDLSELDRILELDPLDGVARVEPGVITAELDRAARAVGMFYAPDPGSVGISTIGGNIATNAGGLRGAKYGVTRDAVLALDVVLADGTLVTLGGSTLKRAAGYDLVSLVVGSEGTLGVVVGATVRLLPAPVETATLSAFFASIDDAVHAVEAIALSGARPSVLEIIDGATLQAIDAARGTAFRADGDAFLLVQTDGFGARAEIEAVSAAIGSRATKLETAADAVHAERLIAVRREALPAVETRGRALIEDIAVPRRRLADAIRGIRTIAEETGAEIFVFGHAGDGNLHPIVLAGGDAAEPISKGARAAADAIFALALQLGGTITAEHGVGALKRGWLAEELGPRVHELERGLKTFFDPLGILNPDTAI